MVVSVLFLYPGWWIQGYLPEYYSLEGNVWLGVRENNMEGTMELKAPIRESLWVRLSAMLVALVSLVALIHRSQALLLPLWGRESKGYSV